MKHTTREAFDTTLDGRDVCIEFDRTVTYGREHYGADADGNRGIWINCIDDESVDAIVVTTYGGDDDDDDGHIRPYAALDAQQQARVTELIDDYCARTEPTPPDEPEPDYGEDVDIKDWWE